MSEKLDGVKNGSKLKNERNPNKRKNIKKYILIGLLIVPLIVCITSFIALGILTDQYNTPPPYPDYIDVGSSTYNGQFYGEFLYIADDHTFYIVDLSDPLNPGDQTSVYTWRNLGDFFIYENFAYISYEGGLAILDISEPLDPGAPLYIDTDSNIRGLYVSGDYVYLAGYDYDDEINAHVLEILNISDPLNPGPSSYVYMSGSPQSVFVSGDYAYVADGSAGLAIINVSDPLNPGTPVYTGSTHVNSVTIKDNFAYIASGYNGLGIIDVSDPLNPGAVMWVPGVYRAEDLLIIGNTVYTSDYYKGLGIIDISNPLNPGIPMFLTPVHGFSDVVRSGDNIIIAGEYRGLAIYNLTEIFDDITEYELKRSNLMVERDKSFIVGSISAIIVTIMFFVIFIMSFNFKEAKILNGQYKDEITENDYIRDNGSNLENLSEENSILKIMHSFGIKIQFISIIWLINIIFVIINLFGWGWWVYWGGPNHTLFILRILAFISNFMIIAIMFGAVRNMRKKSKLFKKEMIGSFSVKMQKTLILRIICLFLIWLPVTIQPLLNPIRSITSTFHILTYIGLIIRFIAFVFEKKTWETFEEIIDANRGIFNNHANLYDAVNKMIPGLFLSGIGLFLYLANTDIILGPFSIFGLFRYLLVYPNLGYFFVVLPLILIKSGIHYLRLGKSLVNHSQNVGNKRNEYLIIFGLIFSLIFTIILLTFFAPLFFF